MATVLFYLMIAGISIAVIFLIVLIWSSILIVGGKEIKVLERRWMGAQMPKNRVFAMSKQIGVQARAMGPGLYFLFPFIYKRKKQDFTVIGTNEIGLVVSSDGDPVPSGKIFAKPIECNLFQDGELFLTNGGEKGPQIPIIPPGLYRINPLLFNVKTVPVTVIAENQIGIVESIDGQPISDGRLLAKYIDGQKNFEDGKTFLDNGGEKGPQTTILLPGKYRINVALFKVEIKETIVIPDKKIGIVVARDGKPLPETEYVAKPIEGHNNFQDLTTFLKNGGQRGPQFDVLKPGTYYINPLMFSVELDDVAVIERGQVAVLVSNVGDEPPQVKEMVDDVARAEKEKESSPIITPSAEGVQDDSVTAGGIEKRLDIGIERYVVPKGFRGIQQEVAGPGIYYLNRRAYIAYVVDTTNITIDWDDSKETRFDPLKVVSHDGFEISVSVKVVIRIRPDQAPYMVAKIGSIQNLVEHVIHPMIDSSFRNQASSTSAMAFMQNRHEEQQKAEDRARQELVKYHVELVSVLICQIQLPEDLMKTQTERIIAQQQQAMYFEQQKAQQSRISMEKTTAEANKQPELVASEIDVKVAENVKLKTIKLAEGEGQSTKLKKEGEAAGIEAIGKAEGVAIEAKMGATAEGYEKQKSAIGQEGVIQVQVAEKIAQGGVKIVPDTLVTNGDSGLLSGVLTKLMTPNQTPNQKTLPPTTSK